MQKISSMRWLGLWMHWWKQLVSLYLELRKAKMSWGSRPTQSSFGVCICICIYPSPWMLLDNTNKNCVMAASGWNIIALWHEPEKLWEGNCVTNRKIPIQQQISMASWAEGRRGVDSFCWCYNDHPCCFIGVGLWSLTPERWFPYHNSNIESLRHQRLYPGLTE